jgi:hypothetical protein
MVEVMTPSRQASTTAVTARWIATVVICAIVAAAGLLVGLGLMADLAGQSQHARSTAATVLMALGILGPFVPAAIAGGRQHFTRMSHLTQWLMLVALPLAHLAAIALLMVLTVNHPVTG